MASRKNKTNGELDARRGDLGGYVSWIEWQHEISPRHAGFSRNNVLSARARRFRGMRIRWVPIAIEHILQLFSYATASVCVSRVLENHSDT